MKRVFYGIARRSLKQETRDRLGRWLARRRSCARPLVKAVHGTFGASDLFNELSHALPNRFDVLMVHCAFDDLLPMYREGALELLRMFESLCGADRTLAMPAFTY